jgi:hypothetical protein
VTRGTLVVLWSRKRQPGTHEDAPSSVDKGVPQLTARGWDVVSIWPGPVALRLTALLGKRPATMLAYALATVRLVWLVRRTHTPIYTTDLVWMRIVSWLKRVGLVRSRFVVRWAGIDLPSDIAPHNAAGRRFARMARGFDACLTASVAALDQCLLLAPVLADRIAFAPTGVDLDFYRRRLGQSAQTRSFVAVGSDWKRDWETPLALIRSGYQLAVLTDNPRTVASSSKLTKLGARVVAHAGFARSAEELAAGMAIVIATLPNRRFSGSTTVGVAAALRKPLILDERADLAAYGLVDGVNCRCFTRGDGESLQRAARAIWNSPALAHKLGEALGRQADALSIDAYADVLEDCIAVGWTAPS